MKVAVVGSGVSGLVVAHHLHRHHDLTLFEADDRVGGHVNTITVDTPDGPVAVDTGFIVSNDRTYPNLLSLFREVGVATRPSDMSFSVSDPACGLEYAAGNPLALYAQGRNVFSLRFHRMLVDVLRCNRALRKVAREGAADDPFETLADFVARHRFSPDLVDRFLVPFGASIWSADPKTFLDMPVGTYARFVDNHGMIDLRHRPRWRTVAGGSATYVEAITAPFHDRIRTSTPILRVRRRTDAGTVELSTPSGTEEFDRVVLAVHSDQALAMLADPRAEEKEVLGAIRYQPNRATLHSDESLLPTRPRARASWNFHLGTGDGRTATLTYWMNRLQGLDTDLPLLVTLNRPGDIDPSLVHHEVLYHHPVFDAEAIRAQGRAGELQGVDGTFYAGAWLGYGFHEDGVRSALDVVRRLGHSVPVLPVDRTGGRR